MLVHQLRDLVVGQRAAGRKPGAGQISHFGAVQVRPGVSAFWWWSCLPVPGTGLGA